MHIIGNGDVETLSTKAEEDFDNPNTLSAAITSVFTAHPADRYGLILWDHGGAWRYGFGGDEQNGTRTGRSIAVEAVATAVRTGLAAANLPGHAAARVLFVRHLPARQPGGGGAAGGPRAGLHRQRGARLRGRLGLRDHLHLARRQRVGERGRFCPAGGGALECPPQQLGEDVLFKSHMALDMSALGAFTTSMNTLVAAAKTSASVPSVARSSTWRCPTTSWRASTPTSAPIPLKDLGQILSSLAQNPAAPVASAAAAARTSLNAMVLARAMGAARGSQAGLNIGAGIPIAFTSPMSALYRQLVPTWNGGTHWADLIDPCAAAPTPPARRSRRPGWPTTASRFASTTWTCCRSTSTASPTAPTSRG